MKDDIRTIYLAGTLVYYFDWRYLIVQGLRNDSWPTSSREPFPVLPRAIYGKYDYVGPFLPYEKYSKESSIPFFHRCNYPNHCMDAIKRADLVAALFDHVDPMYDDWSTGTEILYAVSLGKTVLSIGAHPFAFPSRRGRGTEILPEDVFSGDTSFRTLAPRISLGRQLGLSNREIDCDAGHGFVYFIEATANRHIKIGWSKEPERRLRDFQTASPTEYVLLGTIPGNQALERKLHRDFKDFRAQGEWFHGVKPLRDFIESNLICSETNSEV